MEVRYSPKAEAILAALPELVAAGDLDKIEEVVFDAVSQMLYATWDGENAKSLKPLYGMAPEQRSTLIVGLAPRVRKLKPSACESLARAIEMLSHGLDEQSLMSVLEAQLSHAAAFYEYPTPRARHWAARIRAGGGSFTPEMVAVARREKELVPPSWRKESPDFAEPVLNVGEAWAEQVMAELPELGENWRKLLDHSKTAKRNRPSATWDRKATVMLTAIGFSEATRRLTAWLQLVPEPRTTKLEPGLFNELIPFDPFNAIVACGLVWAAALLPADPDLTRAIGALVEPALVSTNRPKVVKPIRLRSLKLAGAAVTGLERIPGDDSARELERLEDTVVHSTVLDQIRAARAVRS